MEYIKLSVSLLPPATGIRLDENSVFELLKKTDREWDDVAEDILYIKSQDKLDEIRNRFPTDDDRLRESIRFWLKRFPFASYRNLAYKDVPTEFVEPIQGEKILSMNTLLFHSCVLIYCRYIIMCMCCDLYLPLIKKPIKIH